MASVIFDCGCRPGRPKDVSCKSYGTRFRVYTTSTHVILKCRDCGRMFHFELRRPGVQITIFGTPESITEVE